jgi:hypothetical protein
MRADDACTRGRDIKCDAQSKRSSWNHNGGGDACFNIDIFKGTTLTGATRRTDITSKGDGSGDGSGGSGGGGGGFKRSPHDTPAVERTAFPFRVQFRTLDRN